MFRRRRSDSRPSIAVSVALAAIAVTLQSSSAQDAADALPDHARTRITLPLDSPGLYPIEDLIVSADADRLAVVGRVSVVVADIGSARVTRTFEFEEEAVLSAAFGPGENEITVATWGGAVRAFDLATGKEQRRFDLPQESRIDAVLSPDARLVATTEFSARKIEIWDIATEKIVSSSDELSGAVAEFAFNADGSRVACADLKSMRILATDTMKEIARFGFHALAIAISGDGRTVVGTTPWTIAGGDVASGRTLYEMTDRKMKLGSASRALSTDGSLLALGQVGTVSIRDAQSGDELAKLTGHAGPVSCAAFIDGTSSLVTAAADATVIVWDLDAARNSAPAPAAPPKPALDVEGDPLPPHAVARLGTTRFRQSGGASEVTFGPDGSWIASEGRQGIAIWDAVSGERLRELKPAGDVTSIAVAPDGSQIACGGLNDDSVHRWDARTWKALPSLRAPRRGQATALVYSPDSRLLFAELGQWGPGIAAWQAESGDLVYEIEASGGGGLGRNADLAFVASGPWLAIRASGGVELRNPTDGALLRVLGGTDDTATLSSSFAISGDGRLIAFPGLLSGAAVGVFSVKDMKPVSEMAQRSENLGYGAMIDALTMSPDGALVIAAGRAATSGYSGDQPGEVRVFETKTGELLARWTSPGEPVSCVSVSPDGESVAWAGRGSAIHVARLPGLEPAHGSVGHTAGVTMARVLKDNATVLTASSDGTVRRWDLESGMPRGVVARMPFSIESFDMSPDEKRLVLAGDDRVVVVEIDGSEVLVEHPFEGLDRPTSVAFVGKGAAVCVVLSDGSLGRIDIATGKATGVRNAGDGSHFETQLVRIANGRVIEFGWSGVSVIDARAAKVKKLLPDCENAARGGAIDRAGRVAVSIRQTGELTVWDVRTGKMRFRTEGTGGWLGPGPKATPAVSTDGKLVAFSESGLTIHVVDAMTGKPVAEFVGRTFIPTKTTSLTFSPDGRHVIATRADSTSLVFRLP